MCYMYIHSMMSEVMYHSIPPTPLSVPAPWACYPSWSFDGKLCSYRFLQIVPLTWSILYTEMNSYACVLKTESIIILMSDYAAHGWYMYTVCIVLICWCTSPFWLFCFLWIPFVTKINNNIVIYSSVMIIFGNCLFTKIINPLCVCVSMCVLIKSCTYV